VDRISRTIVRCRRIGIVLVAAITAVLGYFAAQVRIDSSVESLIDPADPAYRYYDEAEDIFGSEEIDVVAVVADDVFTPATLRKIDTLSERLRKVRGVDTVTSLATARNISATPDGDIDLSPLMETVPADPAEIARLKAAVYAIPMFVDNLVSSDGTAAAVVITYDDMPDAEFAVSGIHEEVARIVADAQGPERLYLMGIPTLKVTSAHLMHQDTRRFAPLTLVVIALVLFVAFRSVRGVLLPVVTTGIGIVWTVGLMGYFGIPIDIGTLVLPSLLITVGSAYATHIVSRYYEECHTGGSAAEIAQRVVRHLGAPVLVTAATTVFGFASLIVYRINAIRHLGVFSVVGITALFLLALVFTTALLATMRTPRGTTASPTGDSRLARLLEGLGRFDIRHRKAVIAGSFVVLVGFAWGVQYVRVDTSYLRYFPEDSAIRQANRIIGERLSGTETFLVAVDGPKADAITRLDTLQRIAALQDFITRLPGVDKVTSIADYVKVLHRVFHDNDPAYFALPETDAAVQQYLLLLEPEVTAHVVNDDFSRGALLVRCQIPGSTELAAVIAKITRFAADVFPAEFTVRPTGTAVLLNRTADDLARGQLQSVLAAVAIVFAVLSIHFLSVRYGLVAMVPNLIPIVIFFGVLGWAGVSLSLSTAIIACIAVGIGVDEAVHLLSEFNHQVRRDPDQERAVLAAMRSVGPPVVYTTVALFLGFLVPALSSFVPVRQFAVLSAINVVPSLLGDLVLLPALLVTARFVTLWDVLSVKLGGAPQETIPLFHGLRPSQARIAALMGVLKTVGRGEKIVARGEPGNEMYVVIKGTAEARTVANGRAIVLGRMERGDVIGEMGLVRGRPRTADVVGLEDTELLVVDASFLRSLRRRYPRIASTVFFNLTHILSDRLEKTDTQVLGEEEAGEGGG
jgi:predicted RND superfamily exporter protein